MKEYKDKEDVWGKCTGKRYREIVIYRKWLGFSKKMVSVFKFVFFRP